MNENVTLFRDTYETHKPFFLPIDTALNRVKKGTYKAKVNQLRRYRQEDKNKYDEMKPTLPAFVFQGEFTNRSNEDIQKASGFFTADIDKLSGDLESLKQQIANDPSVYAAFISPSNVGIKALFRIPLVTDNDKYHFVFEQISQYTETTYHVKIDRACKDVARICYASYDPDLILHPDATEFHIDWAEYNRQKVQEESEKAARKVEQVKRAARLKAELKKNDAGLDKLDELCQKKLLYHQQWMVEKLSQASPSDPVQGRHQAYIACGILAKSMLDGYASDLTSVDELSAHVASIRADFRPVDKSTFEKLAKDSTEADPITKADIWANYQEWKKDHPDKPKTQEPPHPADVANVPQEFPPIEDATTNQEQNNVFWKYVEVKKGKLVPKLYRREFLAWLQQAGFGIILADKRLKFIRIQDNIVSECLIEHGQNIDIKRFTLEYCQTQKLHDVEEMLLTGQHQYFTLSALNSLQFVDLNFNRDTQDSAFFYFNNVFLEVQRTSVTVKPYSALTGYIWKSQILKYDYTGIYTQGKDIPSSPDGEFCEFLLRVTASSFSENREDYEPNNQKMFAFLSAYGYLLYGWKDVTETKAVICVDSSLGDIDDDGRTGKSLFCESLKYLKRVNTEAGKTWNPEDRFAYQNISLDTQIIFVDDITRKFAFKALYPSITGDLSCEEKGLKKMVIPFDESPKFVITTNTPVKGEGGSDRARQCLLPFSKFFSDAYTPLELFGHRLFVNWTQKDWQEFFDLGIFAVNYFLKHGMVMYEDVLFNEARMTMQIPEQAINFFGNLDRDIEYEKDILKKSAEDFGLTFRSSHTFTRWLKVYCKYWRGTREHPEKLTYVERRTRVDGKNVTYSTFQQVSET